MSAIPSRAVLASVAIDPFARATHRLRDVSPVMSRCVDQDADWHALMFKDGPLTPAEQAMVDAVERGAA